MTIPLGSRPKTKNTSFLAPSSPPEVMEAVNVPSDIVVNGAEAKSLPGTGGLISTYAYVGDSKLFGQVSEPHGLGVESVLLVTIILKSPECCLTLVTGGVPAGMFAVRLLPRAKLVMTSRIPPRVSVAFSL